MFLQIIRRGNGLRGEAGLRQSGMRGIGMLRIAIALAAALALWTAAALSAKAAAAPVLTANQQKAFDRTVAAADTALAGKLKKLHEDYRSLSAQSLDWERKAASAHRRNADGLDNLRKRIRQTDAAKLAALEKDAEATRKRHQKLLDLYQTVNAQLKAAKKMKNKTLVSILGLQADSLKIPVQLARQDIKAKDSAYEAAHKAAQAKIKKLRSSLSAVDPVQDRIRTAKKALGAPNNSRRTVWNAYTKALSKRDAKSASGLLASVNALTRQILERQQNLCALEDRVAQMIRDTEARLAA